MQTTPALLIRRKFQLTDLAANSNKFWMVELFADGSARTTWGRTEKTQQSMNYTGWNERKVQTEINKKLKKGYVEVDLPKVVTLVSAAVLEERTARFIQWISKAAGESIRATTGSIDGLSAAQIARGRQLLLDVQHARLKHDQRAEVAAVEAYYKTIPSKLPAKIVLAEIVAAFDLGVQETRLNQLETALVTASADSTADVYALLGAEIKPMSPDARAFGQIRDLINRTAAGARIEDVFSVKIPAERERFERSQRGKSNVVTLFHGTRIENVRHILRDGFRLPTVVGNGKMYGWGIYFAPSAYKSLSYASNASSPLRVLFFADVALGNIVSAPPRSGDLRRPPNGGDSVVGNEHNMPEYVVYDPAQVTIRAIATIEGKGVRY